LRRPGIQAENCAWLPCRRGDYTQASARLWQYRGQPPGLLAQLFPQTVIEERTVKFLVQWLIDWPRRVAGHLAWLAPLFARITVGWVFLWSGWGKLTNLSLVTENFVGWGIPAPQVLAPFVSGIEFFGGLFLLLGLLTRISAGALGITMIVAIRSAKWADVDSLETLLGFDEFEYLALFLWIAIAGPGALSADYWLQKRFGPRGAQSGARVGA
jgi:putative oxidoreductase